MNIKGRIYIESISARLIEESIRQDNLPSIRTSTDGRGVEIFIESPSVGSLLSTTDDLLMNIKIVTDLFDLLEL
jgi:hypothetical protein